VSWRGRVRQGRIGLSAFLVSLVALLGLGAVTQPADATAISGAPSGSLQPWGAVSSSAMPGPAPEHLASGSSGGGPPGGGVHSDGLGAAQLSTNWSGYVDSGPVFTAVSGEWTVPSIAASDPSAVSQWVGIDGAANPDLIQAGTSEQDVSGSVSYFAWYEILPADAIPLGAVSPGDQIDVSISEDSQDVWTISVEDVTSRLSRSREFSYSGPGASAEWIEEDPSINGQEPPLADFGSTTFSDLAFETADGSEPVTTPIDMIDSSGNVIAQPGALSSNGFNVTYGASPPAPPPPPLPVPPTSPTPTPTPTSTVSPAPGCSTAAGAPLGSAIGIAAIDVDDCPGYYVVDAAGQVSAFGAAQFKGDLSGITLNAPIIAITATEDGGGYWLLGADGGIYAFGDATFFGSTGGLSLNAPIVSMAITPDGGGYWLVGQDGGIFSYGDAAFYGSTGGLTLNRPVDGIAVGPGGTGYWLVASDGGVFAFHEPFVGSLGGTPLNKPIIGMSSGPSGVGYTLVGSDGGVFTFGTPFYGSLGADPPPVAIVAVATVPGDSGYYLVDGAGDVYAFGSAAFLGSASS
jgi:hypothetical protein